MLVQNALEYGYRAALQQPGVQTGELLSHRSRNLGVSVIPAWRDPVRRPVKRTACRLGKDLPTPIPQQVSSHCLARPLGINSHTHSFFSIGRIIAIVCRAPCVTGPPPDRRFRSTNHAFRACHGWPIKFDFPVPTSYNNCLSQKPHSTGFTRQFHCIPPLPAAFPILPAASHPLPCLHLAARI